MPHVYPHQGHYHQGFTSLKEKKAVSFGCSAFVWHISAYHRRHSGRCQSTLLTNLFPRCVAKAETEGSNVLTYLTIQLQLSYGAITYFSSTIKQPQLETLSNNINKAPSGKNN